MCHSARLAQRNLSAGQKKTTKGLSKKKSAARELCVQELCDSDFLPVGIEQMCSHICFVSNVNRVLLHHGVMTYPMDFKFLFIRIDLPYLVTVCRHVGPSVIWSIEFHVAPVKFLYSRAPVVSSARTALDSLRGSTCLR